MTGLYGIWNQTSYLFLRDMKRSISPAASVMTIMSRTGHEKILQLSTKIRLYQTVVMPVLLYAAETWTLLLCDENVAGIPHEVPTPNFTLTPVSA